MIRRLLIALLVLLLAAVVAVDRVGAHVAAHVLAGKLETDEHLSSRPSVTIAGVPFLTQAIGGKYTDVTVVAHDFTTTNGVPVDTLTAHLHGVHIPLSKVISGSVKQVPVDRVNGSAFISFAGIARYLAGKGVPVTLTGAGSNAVTVVSRSAATHRALRGTATVSVVNSTVMFTVGLSATITRQIVLPLPLGALPFKFKVTSVTVSTDGITGTGTGRNVVLGS